MEHITPEMLKPYGVQPLWPYKDAIQADREAPIISRYELESHWSAQNRARQ